MSDLKDAYDFVSVPGIGLKRCLVMTEGIDVSNFGSLTDCYVTLENGKRAVLIKMSENVMMTQEGGIAIKVINDTGGASVKGYVLEPSNNVDNGVKYTDDDDIDPIGIMYSDGVADGEEVWMVVAGIAEVYYGTIVIRGTFSRVPIAVDGLLSGQAVNEALPIPPFATNKHFQEIGHPIESRGTPGLAKTVLHFN